MEQRRTSLSKFYTFSINVIALLFLVLYFILSFHSHLAGDDFYYLWLKNTYGAWNGMLYQYQQWSGRWSAHFIGCEMISQWKNWFFLPFINFLTLGLLYFSLKIGLEKIIILLRINVDKILIPALTLLLITTFFFTSYNIGETWFWYIIILTYLWSIIGFILLLDIIFSKNSNVSTYILISLFSAYIGGASESFALIFLFFLVAILLFRWRIRNQKILNLIDYKLIIALVIIAISFSFSLFAPGTEIRHSLLPHTPLIEKFMIVFKAYIKYFVFFLPNKIVYLFLFSFPWLFIGSQYLKNKFEKVDIRKLIYKTTVLFLICLAVMFIPTSFVMSETGPGRALSIISFLTTIYFAIIFSLLGVYIDFNKIIFKIILSGVAFISILILIYNIYSQFIITKIFSKACDERLRIIENAKENKFTGVLDLKKMPPEGMLYWDELSEDTAYYTNKHLKDGLGLTFCVKLKME